MSRFEGKKALVIILLLQAALSALFVFSRTLDADEGFYLAAAQRVSDGMLPYVDFFFPQMPLLPLLFFALSDWGFASLMLLRVVAAFVGLLVTYLTYRIVLDNTEDRKAAIIAAFLIAFSGFLLNWHATFKPYPFVDLFLLLSFGLLLRLSRSEGRFFLSVFACIAMLMLAVNFRSIFALLLPFYIYLILRESLRRGTSTGKTLIAGVAGFLIPTLPSLVLFAKGPGQFLFNNVGFHWIREPITPFSAHIWHKVKVVGTFVALPQTIMLLGALVGSWLVLKYRLVEHRVLYGLAALMAAIIFVIYLLPTPIHLQYFQQTLPYLIIAALPAILFVSRFDRSRALIPSAAALYAVGILPFLYLFIISPRYRDQRFELPQLRAVVSLIESNSGAQDTLLSEWAGYPALTCRQQMRGSEHVGFEFPLEIARERYGEYNLLTNDNIVSALNERRPELVVVDYRVYPEWWAALAGNYHLVGSSGETFVYKKNHDSL